MQRFEVKLKNEKLKAYRALACILVLLNAVIFIYLLFVDATFYEASAALLLLALYVIFMRIAVKRLKDAAPPMENMILFVLAGCWFGLQNYVMIIACIVLGILYNLVVQKIEFIFGKLCVLKKNFPKKEFPWHGFTNVMIKDNILTMDFKNNKLLQQELLPGQDISEKDFNHFARTQIISSADDNYEV